MEFSKLDVPARELREYSPSAHHGRVAPLAHTAFDCHLPYPAFGCASHHSMR